MVLHSERGGGAARWAATGEVGGQIVAQVLIGLLVGDQRSFLSSNRRWKPFLGAQEKDFTLGDLFNFAGVGTVTIDTAPPITRQRTHRVQRGDTLRAIAAQLLGSAARWPEIFALNRDKIANPDLIRVGMVLVIPD
ncbi:LysM peptidoglycan-binding domain-containing protein [Candidatus Gracilibacteria bacterium]|nr:LysM peptidoglycan-binding domain-containing protein [Candidatus Gracilibacteria bacterium]